MIRDNNNNNKLYLLTLFKAKVETRLKHIDWSKSKQATEMTNNKMNTNNETDVLVIRWCARINKRLSVKRLK